MATIPALRDREKEAAFAPARAAVKVTVTTDIPDGVCRAVWVGTAGTITGIDAAELVWVRGDVVPEGAIDPEWVEPWTEVRRAYLKPLIDVQIDEMPDGIPGQYDAEGNEIKPPVTDYHVNVRYYGASEAALTEGLPQTGGLFERTHILAMVQARTGEALTYNPNSKPPRWEHSSGAALFDPSLIATRYRVWA